MAENGQLPKDYSIDLPYEIDSLEGVVGADLYEGSGNGAYRLRTEAKAAIAACNLDLELHWQEHLTELRKLEEQDRKFDGTIAHLTIRRAICDALTAAGAAVPKGWSDAIIKVLTSALAPEISDDKVICKTSTGTVPVEQAVARWLATSPDAKAFAPTQETTPGRFASALTKMVK